MQHQHNFSINTFNFNSVLHFGCRMRNGWKNTFLSNVLKKRKLLKKNRVSSSSKICLGLRWERKHFTFDTSKKIDLVIPEFDQPNWRSAGLHNTSSHALRITSSPLTSSKIKAAEVITDTCQNLNSDEDEGRSQQAQQSFTQAFISRDLAQEMSLILSTLLLIISHLAPISWMFSGDNLHEKNQCLSHS